MRGGNFQGVGIEGGSDPHHIHYKPEEANEYMYYLNMMASKAEEIATVIGKEVTPDKQETTILPDIDVSAA